MGAECVPRTRARTRTYELRQTRKVVRQILGIREL